jgi:CheY-like chemotaxis protein
MPILLSNPDGIIAYRQKPTPRPGLALNVWRVNVMLVEDDEADADLILHALRQNPQVGTLEHFSAPIDALQELEVARLAPTIIFLDINMPRIDGFQFLTKLRSIAPMRGVPVVFLTTSGSARDVEQAKKSSACAYLVKPDRFEDLKSRLDCVIAQVVIGDRRT